jgi:hypothetical protein
MFLIHHLYFFFFFKFTCAITFLILVQLCNYWQLPFSRVSSNQMALRLIPGSPDKIQLMEINIDRRRRECMCNIRGWPLISRAVSISTFP